MNKKVLASIISLSAVGVLGVGIVCANADKSPVPDIPKTAENGAAMLSTENFQDISGRLEQNQSTGSEIALAAVTDNEEIAKYDIFYKMLNSIDYFDTAEGHVEILRRNGVTTADFACNLVTADCYEKSYQTDGNISEIYTSSDDSIIEVSSENKSILYSLGSCKREYAAPIPNNERITLGADGINTYAHRADPTNTRTASEALFAQDIIFNFMTVEDMWEIDGETALLGRDCVVIKGYTSDYVREKLGVYNFKFTVDKITGVIMDYEGYAEDGGIEAYCRLTEIEFDGNPEIKTFDINDYEDYEYKDISHGIQ